MGTWREFEAAAHVLSDPLIIERARPYVKRNPEQEGLGIEWDDFLAVPFRTFSHGERLLALAALDLWNGRARDVDSDFGLRALVGTLGEAQVRRVVRGMMILGNYGYSLLDSDAWMAEISRQYLGKRGEGGL